MHTETLQTTWQQTDHRTKNARVWIMACSINKYTIGPILRFLHGLRVVWIGVKTLYITIDEERHIWNLAKSKICDGVFEISI